LPRANAWSVWVGDLVVEYSQSRLSDLKALRSEIRGELSAASGRKPFFFPQSCPYRSLLFGLALSELGVSSLYWSAAVSN
jgi:hypothetical protein